MRRWLSRLFCRHRGGMLHISSGSVAGVSFELWRCETCGATIFAEDPRAGD